MTYMDLKGQKLKSAEKQISVASTEDKNFALKCVAEAINSNRKEILAANEKDVQNGILSNMSEGLVDRLKLDDSRIDGIIDGINTVIKLQDPVWKSDRVWTMENGLTFSKMTVQKKDIYCKIWASLIAQLVKNPPAMQETPVQFLGQEDPLEKG